jgi:hypothetical protein
MVAATKYWLDTVQASLRHRLQPLLSESRVIRVRFDEMSRYYPDRVCGRQRAHTASTVVPPLPKPARPRSKSRAANASVPAADGHNPSPEAGG